MHARRATQHDVVTVVDNLRRVVRALEASARTSVDISGVTGAQMLVLQTLRDYDGASVTALAERTFTHQSTVSVVVERLVERGLVAREHSPSDGRRLVLSVTPAGRAVLRRSPPLAQARLFEALAKLSDARLRAFAETLTMTVHAMNIATESPRLFFDEDDAGEKRVARGRRQK